MRQIILNADDFGRHALINDAIRRAAADGLLRSASLMAGEPAFAEAVAIAKATPALGVGVHLTLIDGRPVLPPEEIPSLVDAAGLFRPDHPAFARDYLAGRVRRADIRRELAAQIARVRAAGIVPDHVDSHQHLHVLPGIFPLVLDLAAAAGIRAVRIPRVCVGEGNGFLSGGLGDIIGRLGLYALAGLARRQARRRGFATPDFFAGLVAGAAVTSGYLARLAAELAAGLDGTTEVMLHPGMESEMLASITGWQHDFRAEYDALVAPETRRAFAAHAIETVNFQALG